MPAESKSKPKVVIDTNVFVLGFTFKGKPREVLDLVWRGGIEVCISPFILKELEETLKKDFGWDRDQIKHTIEKIKAKTIIVHPKNKVSVIKEKDDDNRILECAVEGRVQYLISGDRKHLLPACERISKDQDTIPCRVSKTFVLIELQSHESIIMLLW